MTTQNLILIVTATMVALIAGLFYAYSCSVNPGLGKLPDNEYLAAMQSINREILNPVFFASFMGSFFMLPVSTFVVYREGTMTSFWLLLAATVVYCIGTFGVTIVGNVPLNNILDQFNLQSATVPELANMRAQFEMPWNGLHSVRTIANVVALVLVIAACISKPVKTIIS